MVGRELSCAFVAVLVGLSSACKSKIDVHLTDSEQRTFQLECEGPECEVTRVDATPVSPEKADLVFSSPGRILGICDAAAGEANPPPYDCRPITCNTNEQCPPAIGMKHGVCVNEHCIEPSHDITVEDAIMLCLAGTGVGRDTPRQAELYVVAFNCGQPCSVPRVCQQP